MVPRIFAATAAVLAFCVVAAAQDQKSDSNGPLETTSLLGRKLYALPDDDGAIQAAQTKLAADPKNAALILQVSKAHAAKRQYREAVAMCTRGLTVAPDNAPLLLERGHRELGLRDFSAALADLQKAVAINPKQLDEFYHLGLAHYFLRHFDAAAQAFQKAQDLANMPDSVIDCSNWLYVSLRRAGKEQEAAAVLTGVTPDLKNTEPHLLFYLRLLHFYQGTIPESEILPAKPVDANDLEGELAFDTTGYGVGNWHLYNGQPEQAQPLFKSVVTGNAWNSWGFIGSEIELAKRGGG